MVRVLLTRPEQAGRRFAAALQEVLGEVNILLSPLQEIVSLDTPPPPGAPAGVIISSEQAVPAAAQWKDRPAFVVGTRTAEAVEAMGGHVALSAADGRGLVAQIKQDVPMPLWHIRGSHVAVPIANLLTEREIFCHDWIVYDQVAQHLNAPAKAALQSSEPIVLPLFSPRSAVLAMAELEASIPRAPVFLVGLSQAIADKCGGYTVDVAAHANGKEMLKAVAHTVGCVRLLEGAGSVE